MQKLLASYSILLLSLVALPAPSARAETVTIYRDDFGIPHIYAETAEAGLYASGWAMAEDRIGETLKNFLRGMGEYSAAFGPGENSGDYRADQESRMWDHYGVAKKNYERLHPELRKHLAAFVEGINTYMKQNPSAVPEWWGEREVDVYMPIAFSRQFIWSWPAGQAAGDLRKIGLSPSYDVEFPYSNEMAVAPSRTAFGAAMLAIDPHLGWFGRQRYWELRLHAGDIHISGFATAGFPYVNLGHNENIAWAHTTGGPDTADVYELTLNSDNPLRYRYDGEWRELTTREVDIHVKGEEGPRKNIYYYSHHGPIIARKDNKAYAAALAYADEIGYLESKYYFMIAEDYQGAMKALESGQIMPQNVMVADTKGNIYYQRTGLVPIRPEGYDYSAPVDGSTSKTEWKGIHDSDDLISVLNPPQGYMQNCNITPDVMMKDSPMTPDKYPTYLFNQPERLTHQRATRATELLHNNDKITIKQAQAIALDQYCYQYDRWVAELVAANEAVPGERSRDYRRGLRGIRNWDGYQTRDSRGALKYYYWRHALIDIAGREKMNEMIRKVNDYLAFFDGKEKEAYTPSLAREEQELLVKSLEQGMAKMREHHGNVNARFGDVFRVGRLDGDDNVSWPVGGGSLRLEGMATVRSAGFGDERPDHTRWGTNGQTSTQVVILTKPIKSFTQPPIGNSDDPQSPHYRDQAEKLFGPAKMKPSWFNKNELLDGHVKSKSELTYPPK